MGSNGMFKREFTLSSLYYSVSIAAKWSLARVQSVRLPHSQIRALCSAIHFSFLISSSYIFFPWTTDCLSCWLKLTLRRRIRHESLWPCFVLICLISHRQDVAVWIGSVSVCPLSWVMALCYFASLQLTAHNNICKLTYTTKLLCRLIHNSSFWFFDSQPGHFQGLDWHQILPMLSRPF